jgi:outer membrane protein OmpA-like peptidoglycan-associated protein
MRALGLIAAAVLAASPALAQDAGFDAHGFPMVANDGDPRDPLTVQRAGRMHAGEFWGTAVFELADDPLVRVLDYPDDRPNVTEKVIDSLATLNLSLGAAVHDRVRLDVGLPVFVSAVGVDGSMGGGLGDIRLGAMTSIVRPRPSANGGLGFGVAPYAILPTGDDTRFLGQKGVAGGFDLAATFEAPLVTLSASVGPQFNPGVTVDNQIGPDLLVAGAAIGVSPVQELGITVEGRIGAALQGNAYAGTGSPGEVLGSIRYRLPAGLHFLAGGGTAVTSGAGAAAWRAFVGLGFGKIELNFADRDMDGIVNEQDECPDEAETLNAFQDADGCPDQGGRLLLTARLEGFAETDVLVTVAGSGVLERAETQLTPVPVEVPAGVYEVKGSIPGYRTVQRVSVSSGEYPVVLDLEPVVPGFVSVRVVDASLNVVDSAGLSIIGDGAPLDATRRLGPEGLDRYELPPGDFLVFVRSAGHGQFRKRIEIQPGEHVEIEAILRDPRAVVRGDRIEVTEKIYFETGSDVIKPESLNLVEEIATLLISEEQVQLVEIQGHTDAQGSDDMNLDLSQRRAQAVRAYLIQNGVAGSRLTARGFGEAVPIATNDTAEGRAENRRVEFRILRTE